MKKIFTIIAIIFLLGVAVTHWDSIKSFRFGTTAYAVGDLLVNWGVPEGSPIFSFTNFAPGDTESHTVQVSNGATLAREVAIRGINTSETGNLSEKLFIKISENGTDIYGGTTGLKTLSQFFTESLTNGITLSTLQPNTNTSYIFTVDFDPTAGNTFQGKTVVFDLKIGITSDIPAECQNIRFRNAPIFGTQNNDRINGTRGNDLIFALEGNDTVRGNGGNDCIIGGIGDDNLSGGNGEDVLFGNENNDKLYGGNGKDLLIGGVGNDTLEGDNNQDTLKGGDGNDTLGGGNGNDLLQGENNNDTMRGGNGADNLNGGANNDSANGQNGKDTCVAETKVSCEL